MVHSRVLRGVLAAVLVLAALVGVPRRAAASDNLEYIIPAAVTGVVAVIVIVAIVMADDDEPEMDLTQAGLDIGPPREGLRLAPDCAPTAAGRPLLCW
ncbi:MAG: hypothetical protein SF182_27700 [Deltaproteobacteria bacterium]|nr:hypothetical protein [Deltaproteobacteria bacterium]